MAKACHPVDGVISDKVRQIFIKLNELKSPMLEKAMSVDEKTVQKYYREPASVLRFSVL